MKLVVTGAGGLIGWHVAARVHAANSVARFRGDPEPYDLVQLDRMGFQDDAQLRIALTNADGVLHFAGVNRASDGLVEVMNPEIARRLTNFCTEVGVRPHVIYSNSTHAALDTPYGRSKHVAGEILSRIGGKYTNMILPHIFGEGARPRYNNVTATFVEAIIEGESPMVNPDGQVALLHAGSAAQVALDAISSGVQGELRPPSRDMAVLKLLQILQKFHNCYSNNIFPDLRDDFSIALFNSYRAALYPSGFPRTLKLNKDARGTLFEAVKGGGGGQTFLSTTEPGVTRGDHFHLNKVERFLVIQGDAIIRIRKVLSDDVWDYSVSGDAPATVDIPTLHAHSIQNVGDGPLLTLFWTNDLFDPANPDTFADKVLK